MKFDLADLGLIQIVTAGMMTLLSFGGAFAQEKSQVVRIAKLQIDAAQLENYKTALKVEIETSVRVESGILTLNAVAEKDNPTHITIFEVYANQEAYQAQLETHHF